MKQTSREIDTVHGPARVHVRDAPDPRAALLLGHGAGGGVCATDLQVVAELASELRVRVALLEQPYRVAGRRAPAPAKQLDTAWLTVVQALRAQEFRGLPLIFGGRSSGARVACRTSVTGAAAAVLCLAFPEHPPGKPEKSRHEEIDAVTVPVLAVSGRSDPFGRPADAPGREVLMLAGTHSLDADLDGLRQGVRGWLADLLD